MRHLATRSKLCSIVASIVLLGAAEARAGTDLFIDLVYELDPALVGCPNETEFRALVAQQLGYDPYRAASVLGAKVRAWPADSGIEGSIDWNETALRRVGERRFVSRKRDCREMLTTMAFVMSIQIQVMAREPGALTAPEAKVDPVDAPHAPNDTKLPVPAEPLQPKAVAPDDDTEQSRTKQKLASPSPAASSEASSSRWSAMTGGGPSVGLGIGPATTVLGRWFVGLETGRAVFELGAEASLPTTKYEGYGRGVRYETAMGTLAACGQEWSIMACAVAKAGRIGVSGVGVDRPARPDGLLAFLGLRLGYGLGITRRVALLGHVEVLFPLREWTVELNHVPVWTMPKVGSVAGIDLAIRFR